MLHLRLQIFVGRICVLPLSIAIISFLRFYMGYCIGDVRPLRREFRRLRTNERDTPLLICSNHITLIDSIILHWSLASSWQHFAFFKDLSWNVPDDANAHKNLLRTCVTWLGKCVYVNRKGNTEHHNHIINILLYILKTLKQPVQMFPEGGRNRYEFIQPDKAHYGVGRIVQKLDNCNILLIYMRSSKQKTYSDYPPKDSHFKFIFETFKPNTQQAGLGGQKKITLDIMQRLRELEKKFYEGDMVR